MRAEAPPHAVGEHCAPGRLWVVAGRCVGEGAHRCRREPPHGAGSRFTRRGAGQLICGEAAPAKGSVLAHMYPLLSSPLTLAAACASLRRPGRQRG